MHVKKMEFGRFVCLVDGRWSAFSDWGGCSVSCGSSGVSVRTRQCNSPPALRGGMDCTVSGNGTESRPCNLTNCPGNIVHR